jgi:hypothetical protein
MKRVLAQGCTYMYIYREREREEDPFDVPYFLNYNNESTQQTSTWCNTSHWRELRVAMGPRNLQHDHRTYIFNEDHMQCSNGDIMATSTMHVC